MPKLKSWVHNLPIHCHEIETGDRTNKSDTRAISCYKCIFISPHNLIFIPPRIYSTFDILSKTVPLFSVLNFENHNYIGGKKDNNKNIFRLYFGPDLDFVTVCGIKGMVANCLCKRVLTVRHSTMYHSVQSSPPWAEHNTVDTNPYFAGHSNPFLTLYTPWPSRIKVFGE